MSVDHTKLIDSTIARLQSSTEDNLSALEEAVLEILRATPPGVNPRPQIVQLYEQYAQATALEASSLSDLSSNVVERQTEAGIGTGLVGEDDTIESVLLQDAQGTVRSSILNHSEVVAGIIATAAVIGENPTLTQQRVRGAVSGVLMRTSNRDISKMQTQLKRLRANPNPDTVEIRGLTQQIRAGLPPVETRGALIDTMRNTVESVTMHYNNSFTYSRAEREGVERYVYEGTTDGRSRPWCANLAGAEMSKEEIEELWQDDWQGKSGGDPFVDAGGYNCRHYWVEAG